MVQEKHTLRLIISVITGIVIAKVLGLLTHEILYLCTNFPSPSERMFEPRTLIIILCFHSFYAVLSAMITARIAKDKAKKAVFILGTKEAVLWILGTVLLWKHSAPWFNITKVILGIPFAMLGGWIYSYFHRRSEMKSITHA